MISQSDLFKLFRMISRRVISCDECAFRFYVCSIFVDRVFVPFIFHHGVHWTYKCFAYVAPRGWIWVRRGLCGFGDIRGSVGRYDPWGIKATGFAVTTKINHYAAVTRSVRPVVEPPVLLQYFGLRRHFDLPEIPKEASGNQDRPRCSTVGSILRLIQHIPDGLIRAYTRFRFGRGILMEAHTHLTEAWRKGTTVFTVVINALDSIHC